MYFLYNFYSDIKISGENFENFWIFVDVDFDAMCFLDVFIKTATVELLINFNCVEF